MAEGFPVGPKGILPSYQLGNAQTDNPIARINHDHISYRSSINIPRDPAQQATETKLRDKFSKPAPKEFQVPGCQVLPKPKRYTIKVPLNDGTGRYANRTFDHYEPNPKYRQGGTSEVKGLVGFGSRNSYGARILTEMQRRGYELLPFEMVGYQDKDHIQPYKKFRNPKGFRYFDPFAYVSLERSTDQVLADLGFLEKNVDGTVKAPFYMGHSTGGGLALAMTAAHPAYSAGLISLAGWNDLMPLQFFSGLFFFVVPSTLKNMDEKQIRADLRRTSSPKGEEYFENHPEIVADFVENTEDPTFYQIQVQQTFMRWGSLQKILKDPPKWLVNKPKVWIHGGGDRRIPVGQSRRAQDRIGGTLVVYDDANHQLPADLDPVDLVDKIELELRGEITQAPAVCRSQSETVKDLIDFAVESARIYLSTV